MKKQVYLIAATVSLVLFCFSSLVLAYVNSGTYLGSFDGNDNDFSAVYSNIMGSSSYTGPSFGVDDFDFYATVNDGETVVPGLFYVTYEPDYKSGTWATFTAPESSGEPISFYTVKGGNEYAIYWEEVPTDKGFWSTGDLENGGGNIPAISHFSAFTSGGILPDPVLAHSPEPSTVLLLGFGFVFLSRACFRKA